MFDRIRSFAAVNCIDCYGASMPRRARLYWWLYCLAGGR